MQRAQHGGGAVPLLMITEVAAVLRVSKRTAYALVRSGQLPSVRIGRRASGSFRPTSSTTWRRRATARGGRSWSSPPRRTMTPAPAPSSRRCSARNRPPTPSSASPRTGARAGESRAAGPRSPSARSRGGGRVLRPPPRRRGDVLLGLVVGAASSRRTSSRRSPSAWTWTQGHARRRRRWSVGAGQRSRRAASRARRSSSDSGHGFHVHVLLPGRAASGPTTDPRTAGAMSRPRARARLFLEDEARELFGACGVPRPLPRGRARLAGAGRDELQGGEGKKSLTADRAAGGRSELVHAGTPEGSRTSARRTWRSSSPSSAPRKPNRTRPTRRKNGRRRGSGASEADGTGRSPGLDSRLPIRQRVAARDMNPSEGGLRRRARARQGRALRGGRRGRHPRPRGAAGDIGRKAARSDYVDGTVARPSSRPAGVGRQDNDRALGRDRPARVPRRLPAPTTLPPRRAARRWSGGTSRRALTAWGAASRMVALPVLVVAGLRDRDDPAHPPPRGAPAVDRAPVLWAALVAESGQMKSPALDLAIALIRRHEQKAARENEEIRRQYERDVAIYERDHARYQEREARSILPRSPSAPRTGGTSSRT